MPKTVSVRKGFASLVLVMLAGFTEVACHHTQVATSTITANTANTTSAANATSAANVMSTAPAALTVQNHTFGDSTHAIRVLSFNRSTETADVFVRQPRNVIVLAVEPGREIEVIYPGSMTIRKLGSDKFAYLMRRFELTTSVDAAGASTRSRQAYEQCMRNRAALQREAARRVVRDSTGRIISGGDPPLQREPPTCSALPAEAAHLKAMPPREPRERYLVVLTSTASVTPAELEQRMEALTTIASDVALTIEAIAAGIFAGKVGTFGGAYVSW